MTDFRPGERFLDAKGLEKTQPNNGIWAHLGWRLIEVEPGRATLEWEPTIDHAFPAGDDWIVHGGMVTALLDTAMGQSTWTLLDRNEVFLTADLHTDFYRATRPGPIRAEGHIVHKTRRLVFAVAELFDGNGKLLAGGRATNTILPQDRS